MTWSTESASHPPWAGDVCISPKQILYSYDGPTIFTASFGFFDALFLKVEELSDGDLFLAAATNDEIITAIMKGKLSVRGGYAVSQYWIVQLNHNLSVLRYWNCNKDELPEDFLPDRNLALFAHLGRAPDTLVQSSAFFAMAFQGQRMAKSGMPFSKFKGLVDAAHDAARKVLTPLYLAGTRTKTFDYALQEPSFSSLILAIKRPLINEIVAARRMPAEYANDGTSMSVQEHFFEQRDQFLEEMKEIVKQANAGQISDDLVQERYFTLGAIQGLIPTEDNELTSVDFTGASVNHVDTVEIGARSGARMRSAYVRADGLTREIAGKIEIINSASSYFVLLTEKFRQINCSMDYNAFKKLERNPDFRNGSFVWVRGNLYRRTRRDWLRVDGDPRLQAAPEDPHDVFA